MRDCTHKWSLSTTVEEMFAHLISHVNGAEKAPEFVELLKMGYYYGILDFMRYSRDVVGGADIPEEVGAIKMAHMHNEVVRLINMMAAKVVSKH